MNIFLKYTTRTLMVVILLCSGLFAQHRGDNLYFQGLTQKDDVDPVALGMAGAYTAMQGDLTSLFYNPAGLATLDKLKLSISASSQNKEQWENQVYRPNRLYVTLPFYLEGLYVPDPANNGIPDYQLALDSSYVVNPPDMGKDPTSKEAADWKKKFNDSGLSSVAAAWPFSLGKQNIVVAGAWSADNMVQQFDRNDSYLDPHIGTSLYDGFTDRLDGTDTLNVNWYRYLHQRTGTLYNTRLAVAYSYGESFNFALAANYRYGETDDRWQLNKVGYFGMMDENDFFFSYDTLNQNLSGTSDFSCTSLELGIQYSTKNVRLGLQIETPSTLTRKWKLTKSVEDTSGMLSKTSNGTDKLELPAKFNIGLVFKPASAFTFAIDYGFAGYASAKFKPATADSTRHDWKNQQSLRVGAQVQATDMLTLRAGYRAVSQVFVPDGSAYDGRGPDATSWTLGAGLDFEDFGRIDASFEWRNLKYYDQYYSNTNYQTEELSRLVLGYTYNF